LFAPCRPPTQGAFSFLVLAVSYVEISFQLDEQRAYSRGLFAFTGRGT